MIFSLVPCDVAGVPTEAVATLPDMVRENARLGAALYERCGFVPPWIGYIAVADGHAVGGGAFVGPPRDGIVEIAYYSLPELERRGHATRTARALVDIARNAQPGIILIAHTLPHENPSTIILRRLGFAFHATSEDPDEGPVWQWRM
ncbi:MAG: GNAT family N-acetyltransferase [Tahibacter sp.]